MVLLRLGADRDGDCEVDEGKGKVPCYRGEKGLGIMESYRATAHGSEPHKHVLHSVVQLLRLGLLERLQDKASLAVCLFSCVGRNGEAT